MSSFHLRPEETLLVLSARWRIMGFDRHEALPHLMAPIDWEYLLLSSIRHGIMPLLYSFVSGFEPAVAPGPFLNSLREIYHQNGRKNLLKAAELLGILKLLQANGLRALPFKGPVLALILYGDIALRQFNDIDILVEAKDVLAIRNLMLGSGYRSIPQMTPRREEAYLKHGKELCFLHPADNQVVEIQWRFSNVIFGDTPNPAAVFQRSVPFDLLGHPVISMNPEDLFFYLCLHGKLHVWPQLSMVCEVAQLRQLHPDWNWEDMLRKACALRLRRAFLLAMGLCEDWLGLPVPPELTKELQSESDVSKSRNLVNSRLFANGDPNLKALHKSPFSIRTTDTIGGRLRIIWSGLTCPSISDWRWVSLPDGLYFLYYPLRWIRLAMEGLAVLARRVNVWFR